MAFCALTVAGCATRPPPAPPPRGEPRTVPVAPAPTAAPGPAAYVEAAGSGDLFIVMASELALQRLSSGSDRRLAEMLARDHRGMSAQLSLSGRRLNLLPGADLLPKHRTRLAALESSGDFAADYRRQVAAVHLELFSLHSSFARLGSSPTLKPVAAAAATRIRAHLDQLD